MAVKTVITSELVDPTDPELGYINTYSDGTSDTTLSSLEPGSSIGTDDKSSGTTFDPTASGYKKNADGTYTKTFDDGSTSTVDAGGNPVSSTEQTDSGIQNAPTNSSTLSDLATKIQNLLKGGGLGSAATTAGLAALAKAIGGGSSSGLAGGTAGVYRGYQGGIPTLTASRTMNQIPAGYRPGGGGLSYFSPVTFTDSSGKVVPGVAGSGSPMNVGDVTGNVTGPTSAGALTATNTNLPGGITTVGNTYVPPTTKITNTNTGTNTNTNTSTNTGTNTVINDQLAAANAEVKRLTQQTDMGNIVQKYAGKTDPASITQMQVELAQYMDKNGISTSQLPNIIKGASYATGWTPDTINKVYQSIDPLAQVVAAYNDKTKTPAQVAALAAQNNITTQQLQNYGVDTAGLNNLAAQGYLSTPLLTSTLQQDYNAGTPAGIASINKILSSNPSLTTAKIQQMFPGIDLNAISKQGINIPGYTPTNVAAAAPTKTTAPTYTNYSNQNIGDYIAQSGINVNDPVAVAAAVAAQNADPAAVSAYISNMQSSAPAVAAAPTFGEAVDTSVNGASGGVMRAAHYARGGYALGGISSLGTYSDGGRMLKGPGDGVSDSIPAMIGGHQKAALADGEFVIPARIVSEIGNGSSDAGARKLYEMMDRIQKARKKTTKNVAANTRAEQYLPG
jgi:hypothetical protein